MKFRFPWRALLAFMAAVALPVMLPAVASAAVTTFTMSATSLGAGTDPGLISATTFDATAGSPQSITLDLAPGLLASAAANPSCLTGTPQLSSTTPGTGCNVGSGTFQTTPTPVTYNAYIIPAPSSSDISGVEVVTSTAATATGKIDLRTTPTVGLNVSLNLSALPFASTLTSMSLTVSGTLNSNQFTRLPTTCVADTSSVVVAYSGTPSSETATNTTAAAATPTGCAALPFTPTLAATVTKDMSDSNVAITTDVSQPASPIQAPDKTLTLTVPPTFLFPNIASVTNVFGKGISVGTAVATSPLIPIPLTGNVTLTGTSELAPNLTITFNNPFPLVLAGAVNATQGSVTFSSIPDVPLTGLAVSLTGGANGLYETTCSPATGTLMGAFTGQNGLAATSSPSVTIGGCASPTVGKPTASGTVAGLVKKKASVKFTVNQGMNAKPIKTIAITLPSGLSLSKNAKNLKKGIHVSGGTFKVSHGALVITLKNAASKATITLASPAVSVSNKLAKTVKTELKKHKAKALSFKLKVTDSGSTTTTLSVKATPKS